MADRPDSWFSVAMKLNAVGDKEPPAEAATGWGLYTDLRCDTSQTVGDAIARVLTAVNSLHGSWPLDIMTAAAWVVLKTLDHGREWIPGDEFPAAQELAKAATAYIEAVRKVNGD